ncbi:MAG: hypothetical protein HYW50_01335 [Candidatus Diapherotrites archaeon]|nr:hypothetical protein [Candidatus Diapherotrites archaeon]
MGVFFTQFFAWYQKFGYNFDPLSIKPSAELVAREKELVYLSENIVSGSIVLLQGEAGLGKTSLLKALEKNFKEDKELNVKYVSLLDGFAGIKKRFLAPNILESFLFLLGFWKKKKHILLVDECQLLTFNQAEGLRNMFDTDQVHSMVMACGEKNSLNLSLGFKRRISDHLLLSELSVEQLKLLLKKRFSKTNPLHEETVDYLAKASEGNPRQFLLNCKKVCMQVHEFFKGEGSITLGQSKGIVGNTVFKELAQEKNLPEENNALENLTPLQRAILEQLAQGPASLKDLSQVTGSSVGTVGKQISVLCLKTKKDYMARKGVTESLIKKDKDQPTTMYHLTEKAKELLNGPKEM